MGTIAIGGGFLFIGFWLETIINRLDKKANVGTTIIDAFHKKISIFEIISRDTLDSIRSSIFKQLNGLS
jgi:hypothetical protein